MADDKHDMNTCALPLNDVAIGQPHEALEPLIADSLDRAYTQARRTLGNDADAQDAVQEAVIQVMRSAPRYDHTRPFGPWLARHVHDACCRLRWRARRAQVREQEVARPAVTTPVDEVDAEAVRAAVAHLPEGERVAVELHYWAGLPQAEIARELGVSENALSVRLHRARERLRGLLQRRGVTMGAASLLAALTPAQAWSAPPALVAGTQSLTTATAWPATSMPLGVVRETGRLASRHPWWLAGAAACVVGGLGFGALPLSPHPAPAVVAAEVAPPPKPPQPVADAPWSGPSGAVLRWLDPDAPVHLAVDLAAMRRSAAQVKPWSLLADPQVQPAIARLRAIADTQTLTADVRGLILTMLAGVETGDGVVLSGGQNNKGMTAVQVPEAVGRDLAVRLVPLKPAPGATAVDGGTFESGVHFGDDFPSDRAGIPGRVFAWGDHAAVAARAAAPAVAVASAFPNPAWCRADFGPLLKAYAAEDTHHSDPAQIGEYLGSDWHVLAPLFESWIDVEDGVSVSTVRLSRATGLSPLTIAPIMAIGGNFAKGTPWPPFRVTHRHPDPKLILARPAKALLWGAMGLERTHLVQAFGPWLQQSLPGSEALLPKLSGDVSVVVMPGAPFPTATVILGLAGALDPSALAGIATAFELTAAPAKPPAVAAWQGFSPIGPVSAQVFADRLMLTIGNGSAPDLQPGPSVAADLLLAADLPGIITQLGPLVSIAAQSLPVDLHELLNSRVLAEHLATWELSWSVTEDGFLVHERGFPALAMLGSMSCAVIQATSDPVEESRNDRAALAVQVATNHHRLTAIQATANRLIIGGPYSAADRQAMAPWFSARPPSDAELAALGVRYRQGDDGIPNMNIQVSFAGKLVQLPDGQWQASVVNRSADGNMTIHTAMLRWAAAVDDAWCIGIVGTNQHLSVGFFKGKPPVAANPPPAGATAEF